MSEDPKFSAEELEADNPESEDFEGCLLYTSDLPTKA